MKNPSTKNTTSIISANIPPFIPPTTFVAPFSIESEISPLSIIILTALATPIVSPTPTSSDAPVTNSDTALFSPSPERKQMMIPTTKNSAVISRNHQPWVDTPQIITANESANIESINLRFTVNSGTSLFSCKNLFSRSAFWEKIRDFEGSFFTFSAYLIIYAIVIIVAITSPAPLNAIPFINEIPAALEAITDENGFTVENIVPIEEPIYKAAIHTIASYPATINTGTSIGYKAIVSSASPNVVPPSAIKKVTIIISRYSFPFVNLDRLANPASKAPLLFKIPMIPPMISTKIIMSIVS